jgi:broad specificity phosphatase PhoE
MRLRGFACLSLCAALLLPVLASAAPTIIYLTRHAEKTLEKTDPPLTQSGQARARNIATVLHKAGIGRIFSTSTARTRQTAAPLAEALALPVQIYDPAHSAVLREKIVKQPGASLVVGHSNTVPDLVRLFGGRPGADIGDDEYERLYQLIIEPDGQVTTVLLNSSALAPPADASR